MDNIFQLFQKALSRFPENAALKERHQGGWDSLTYSTLGDHIKELGTGLIALGLKPDEKVGLFINKGKKWLIGDLAILGAGAVDVPRGSEVYVEELTYICRHAGLRIVLGDFSPGIADALRKGAPELSCIISPGESVRLECGFRVFTWNEVREKGKTALLRGDRTFAERAGSRRPDDLASIVYTSGTTGKPKGVMLTHSNIVENVKQILGIAKIEPGEIFLSILPPYHMFERVVEYVALTSGGHLVFSELNRIGEDFSHQRPHYIAGVPRLWEMIYHSAMDRLKKEKHFPLIQKLIRYGAVKTQDNPNFCANENFSPNFQLSGLQAFQPSGLKKIAAIINNIDELLQLVGRLPFRYLAERLVFRKLRAKLGGRLKLAISGGGTLPVEIDRFFNSAGICLLNGYGLTETSPVLTLRSPGRNIMGTVGEPLPGTHIKICDENGETLGVEKTGIIWAKGPQVMKGYYKDPEATDAVLLDGWFNTGDIGLLNDNGNLTIKGRAKDTIVLLSGENIEPEPIENRLALSPFISQAMVVGQDRKHLGVLIVPNWKNIDNYAREQNLSIKAATHESNCPSLWKRKARRDFQEGTDSSLRAETRSSGANSLEISRKVYLAEYPEILQLIKSEIDRLHNRKDGTRSWERIARFKLTAEEWTLANGLMTFTLKKKRNAIVKKHEAAIRELY